MSTVISLYAESTLPSCAGRLPRPDASRVRALVSRTRRSEKRCDAEPGPTRAVNSLRAPDQPRTAKTRCAASGARELPLGTRVVLSLDQIRIDQPLEGEHFVPLLLRQQFALIHHDLVQGFAGLVALARELGT